VDRQTNRQDDRQMDKYTDRQTVYPSVHLSAFCENLFPICRLSLFISVSADGQTDRQTDRQSVIRQFNHTSIREKKVHFQSVKEEADS
jgi:hypothetical protein